MKRNNIFMWAYISFIFVAILIRLFFDYHLWTPLVMAITLSSIPFACEDLCASFAKTLRDTYEINENFTQVARKKAEKALLFHEKSIKNLDQFESVGYDISFLQKTSVQNIDLLTVIMQTISDIEQNSVNMREKQDRYQKAAGMLAYLGFLVLFCTLILAPSSAIPAVIQDIITVSSFSVILITHQFNAIKLEEVKDSMVRCQKMLRDFEEVEEHVFSTEKNFDELIKLIETPSDKSKEDHDHAD